MAPFLSVARNNENFKAHTVARFHDKITFLKGEEAKLQMQLYELDLEVERRTSAQVAGRRGVEVWGGCVVECCGGS